MITKILKDASSLGEMAAKHAAEIINENIQVKGNARILVSTGGSQFEFFKHFVKQNIDWSKLVVFNLDEYVGIRLEHKASFRKYLRDRLVNKTNIKEYYFVDGEGDMENNIKLLTEKINEAPIDLGVIGIGENAHIAFNDPPADFETKKSYIVVDLDEKCKMQQVGEGWFDKPEDVPPKAITMTPFEILKCKKIISCVPHKEKAEAVKNSLYSDVNPNIPASILKTHLDWTLYLDENSASLLKKERDYE